MQSFQDSSWGNLPNTGMDFRCQQPNVYWVLSMHQRLCQATYIPHLTGSSQQSYHIGTLLPRLHQETEIQQKQETCQVAQPVKWESLDSNSVFNNWSTPQRERSTKVLKITGKKHLNQTREWGTALRRKRGCSEISWIRSWLDVARRYVGTEGRGSGV